MTQNKKFIFLAGLAEATPFTSTGSGGKKFQAPPRDRARHGAYIQQRLEQAWAQAKREREIRKAVAIPTRDGTYLEFEGAPGFDLKTESLENRRKGIRLVNVRAEALPVPVEGEEPVSITRATVYIPAGNEGDRKSVV